MNYLLSSPCSMSRTQFFVRALCLCTLMLNGFFVRAQNPVTPDFKKVPTPPSPSVAALGKFGDIPVSPSTGVPDISIPIYNYQDNQKDLSLGVSLQYHAGGHKVEDMASNVGLGWALNAGGVISRTMRGLPDDAINGYLNTSPLPSLNNTAGAGQYVNAGSASTSQGISLGNDNTNFYTVKQIAENTYDGECDIFNLNVGSINEKFFYAKNKAIIFVTPNNLKVTTPAGQGNFSQGFIVTDANGVKFYFDVQESIQTDNVVEPTVPAPPMYVSAWYLSKIVSADGLDEIQFQYQNTTSLSYESALTQNHKTDQSNGTTTTTSSHSATFTYNAKRISRILLPDKTEVDFHYSTEDREDYKYDKKLVGIEITSAQLEKTFTLQHDYFVSPSCASTGDFCPPPSDNNWYKRLKLLSVQERSGPPSQQPSIVKPPYTFEYNSTALPTRNSKRQDWWGYYNGGAAGSVIPYYPTTYAVLGPDRIPSLQHCKAWILEKIIYPTGGHTQFTYELNEGVADAVVKPIGGLRVQKKDIYDPVTNATYTTSYSYKKQDNTTSGLLLTIPTYSSYMSYVKANSGWDMLTYFNESLGSTQSLTYFNGSPVIYTRVKEEQIVTGQSNGYKVYEYTSGQTGNYQDSSYPFVQSPNFGWERGLLTKMSILNSSNDTVSVEKNQYQTTWPGVTPPTLANVRNLTAGAYQWDDQGTITEYLFGVETHYIPCGKAMLKKTTKKEFMNATDFLSTVTEYTYDDQFFLPTLTKTTDSKGRTIEQRTYYPFHYNTTGFPRRNDLVNANRVAETISVEEWLIDGSNSSVRSIVVNDFETVNTSLVMNTKTSVLETRDIISLNSIGVFNPSNMYRSSAIKEKIKVETFDSRGRGVGFKYNGDERHALIWGDHNDFPIASVKNAVPLNVAYTSFETSTNGTWTYNPISIADPVIALGKPAPTGKKAYSVAAGISKTVDPGSYIVSLWRHTAASVSVNSTTPVRTGKTIDNWVYLEFAVSGPTISISGSGYVDEVRLFPAAAQMTSYTFYSPQQIATQSDPNGTISRFEYDALGRLKTIKDEDGKIIKKMDYHYQSQQ